MSTEINDFFADVIVLSVIDPVWGVDAIPALDAKDFDLYGFDDMVEFAQCWIEANGTPPNLENYGMLFIPGVEDIIKELKTRFLTPDRIAYIKDTVHNWHKFRMVAKMYNLCCDVIETGFEDTKKLDFKIESILSVAKTMEELRDASTPSEKDGVWLPKGEKQTVK